MIAAAARVGLTSPVVHGAWALAVIVFGLLSRAGEADAGLLLVVLFVSLAMMLVVMRRLGLRLFARGVAQLRLGERTGAPS
jgi:hypothetical protein